MSKSGTDPKGSLPPIDFMARFVASAQFQQVFEEGMRLVEETADYLDGPGREAARAMSRDDAMAYATESMRLTTRLMQMASWLLLQRAVAAGELSERDARREQENINLPALAQQPGEALISRLPPELTALMERAQHLYERILRLNDMIRTCRAHDETGESPLSDLIGRIEAEFLSSAAPRKDDENGR